MYITSYKTERAILEAIERGASVTAVAKRFRISPRAVLRMVQRPQIDPPLPESPITPREQASARRRAKFAADAAKLRGETAIDDGEEDDGCRLEITDAEAFAEYDAYRARKQTETPPSPPRDRLSLRAENVVSETFFKLEPSRYTDIFSIGDPDMEAGYFVKMKAESKRRRDRAKQ